MTLLAHWKIDEGHGSDPTSALDSAGGGSGAHDGDYVLSSTGGRLLPGGVGGHHMLFQAQKGYIQNIANAADLKLMGEMTVLLWIHPDLINVWGTSAVQRFLANYSGDGAIEAENYIWDFRTPSNTHGVANGLRFLWEYGAGVSVSILTPSDVLPPQGWCHAGAVRYEISVGYYGVKFYVDGQLAYTADNGGPGWQGPTGGANSLPYVGRCKASNTADPYYYDSVRIYDTAESQANIQAVYEAERDAFFNGLPGKDDWPLVATIDEDIGPPGSIYRIIESGPHSLRDNAGFV